MTSLVEKTITPERIALAWSDPEVRRDMPEEELVRMPDHPAGPAEAPQSVLASDPTARITFSCRPPWNPPNPGDPTYTDASSCPTRV
jgi:mersacidin/lichenicidin family type 2 lantibiotic